MAGAFRALDPARDVSPQLYARIGGILYLVIILAGMSGELLIRGPAIVSGNPAATAVNIASSASL